MEKSRTFLMTSFLVCTVANLFSSIVSGLPIYNSINKSDANLEKSKDFDNIPKNQIVLECDLEEYPLEDVVFLDNSHIILKPKNVTIHPTHYRRNNGTVHICLYHRKVNRTASNMSCKSKFIYEKDDYHLLKNRSVLLFGEILQPSEYELRGTDLLVCVPDDEYDDYPNGNNFKTPKATLNKITIYVGKIGSAISIVALLIHLLTFCFVPALRNLPGYNIAALSVAFLFAYSFMLIGQIPEVLGIFCVISGVLQQYFFLVAFFCMNVMAFDVWRTLKLATEKLILGSNKVRKMQLFWYSLYAWGCPLIISVISILADNINGVPDSIKPYFGRNSLCWMTNGLAKTIFFTIPAFTLFIINGIFFVRSSIMISSNLMTPSNDQQSQSVKLNHILYVRLALMLGITWLVGVIAMISRNDIVWFIHDFLNSLQGLLLFLLFTCSKKVVRHLKVKSNLSSNSGTQKQTSSSTKSDSR